MTRKAKYQKFVRTRLAIFAFAYEFRSNSLIGDKEYDELSLLVDPAIETDNPELDKFFREHYHPATGQWIHSHPQLAGIERIYNSIIANRQHS